MCHHIPKVNSHRNIKQWDSRSQILCSGLNLLLLLKNLWTKECHHSYRFCSGCNRGRRGSYQPHQRWLMSQKPQAVRPSLPPESICYFQSLSVSVSAALSLQLISSDRWGEISSLSIRHSTAFSLACHQVYHPFLNSSFIQMSKEPHFSFELWM